MTARVRGPGGLSPGVAALALLLSCAAPDPRQISDHPGTSGHGGNGGLDAGLDGGGAAGAAGMVGPMGGASGSGGMGGAAGAGGLGDASVGCVPNPDPDNQVCTQICPESCNDLDDDCDRKIDEDEAGDDCDLPNSTPTCVKGACIVVTCDAGFLDCDSMPDNGCEADLTTPEHCGSCTNVCAYDGAIAACVDGACEPAGCIEGFADCDSSPSSCETPTTTLTDCGGCGQPCDGFQDANSTCDTGTCALTDCVGATGDCNTTVSDGCEQALNTPEHCGGCNVPCSFQGSTASCATGVCQSSGCAGGFDECDGNTANGCEALDSSTYCGDCATPCDAATLTHVTAASCNAPACDITCATNYGNCDAMTSTGCETDLTNILRCGACNTPCSFANATAECSTGSCSFVACKPGWGNCDNSLGNGCETDLNSTLAHCGACMNDCAAVSKTSCNGGQCSGVSCPTPGTTDCNESDGVNCETNLADVTTCGGCANACAFGSGVTPHGNLACVSTGASSWGCAVTCTDPNWADCDGSYANGCETDLRSTSNCGACFTACSIANASETCADRTCKVAACDADWGDCDLNPLTCETRLDTSSNCGSCGNACAFANAIATCGGTPGSRACTFTQCTSLARANCDGMQANGCEVDLTSDVMNCNGCGAAFDCLLRDHVADASCVNSSCTGFVCDVPFADCTGASGCETDLTSTTHCGSCNNDCTALPHIATVTCSSASCDITACDPGYGDCDAGAGCETDVLTDANHCGACSGDPGHQPCTGSLPGTASGTCTGGVCSLTCDPGFLDCNGDSADGCEKELAVDGPCCNPLLDQDADGYNDCTDECPLDASKILAGDCGCPSAPVAGGTLCGDGLCAANVQCDGAGSCGSPAACAPAGTCTFARYPSATSTGYWFCTNAVFQAAAAGNCGALEGGNLVRVDDMTENDFLFSKITADSWLGGSDVAVEGAWRWPNNAQFWSGAAAGSALLYAHWNTGEPNDSGGQDCAVIWDSTGRWDDLGCATARPYICEVAADQCPNDPKLLPGVCGCAVPETGDSDGDGTFDCNDGCMNDPNKTAPGTCGCGTPDTDLDGDGAICNDGCPRDAAFTTVCNYKRLTVDPTFVDCNLTSFPVLVRFSNDAGLKSARADGHDLFFSTDSGPSNLDFEIDHWDKVAGDLTAWVRVPTVSGTVGTTFYLRYADGSALDRSNAGAVWDTSYEGVWHLETAASPADSTALNHDGTNFGATNVTGVIGLAADFVKTKYMALPASTLSRISGAPTTSRIVTFSFWAENDVVADQSVFGADENVHPTDLGSRIFNLHFPQSNGTIYWDCDTETGFNRLTKAAGGIAGPPWSHWAVMMNNTTGQQKIYVDGALWQMETDSNFALDRIAGRFTLGAERPTLNQWDGRVDEFRVSRNERSACWIRAEYENQRPGSTFLVVGP